MFSIIMFIFASPGTVPVFARSYGYMNLIGVSIQLIFPCSPPWYENMYGLAPANYTIKGSPAGLARIDKLFGIALYTPGFTGSPMVFGAFPSLHAGSAVMEALFMSHVFPRMRPLFVVYALWLWWATMYLSHHYAVDLVGGSLRRFFSFFFGISATNFEQLLGLSSMSPRPSSYQESRPTRCFDGIMTTKKWAKTRSNRVTHLQTSATDRMTVTTGLSVHLLPFPPDPSAPSTTTIRSGKERPSHLIPTVKPSGDLALHHYYSNARVLSLTSLATSNHDLWLMHHGRLYEEPPTAFSVPLRLSETSRRVLLVMCIY